MESSLAIHNTLHRFRPLLKDNGFQVGVTDCHSFVVYYLSLLIDMSWIAKYGLELFNKDNFKVMRDRKITTLKLRSLIASHSSLERISNPFLSQTGAILLGPKRITGIYDGKGILTISENGIITRLPIERTYEMYKII